MAAAAVTCVAVAEALGGEIPVSSSKLLQIAGQAILICKWGGFQRIISFSLKGNV